MNERNQGAGYSRAEVQKRSGQGIGVSLEWRITVPEMRNGDCVFVPVMEDGKAVVRPLTAEDIDRLGPACLAVIIGEIWWTR